VGRPRWRWGDGETGREIKRRFLLSLCPVLCPLRRYLQHNIETRLAKELIAGRLNDGQKVVVDVRDGSLEFKIY